MTTLPAIIQLYSWVTAGNVCPHRGQQRSILIHIIFLTAMTSEANKNSVTISIMSISNKWFSIKYRPNDLCGVCSHLAPISSTLSYASTLSFAPFLYTNGPIYLTINTITYVWCAWNCNPGKFYIIFSDTPAESSKFTQWNTLFQQHIHAQQQPILWSWTH
jgi:hypothetical protein